MAVGSEPGADLVDALLGTIGHERMDDVRDERDSHAAVSTTRNATGFQSVPIGMCGDECLSVDRVRFILSDKNL